MEFERGNRGRLQFVRKSNRKGKGKEIVDSHRPINPPVRIDAREPSLPSSRSVSDRARGNSHQPSNDTRLSDRSRRPPAEITRHHFVPTAYAADRYLPDQRQRNYPPNREQERHPHTPDVPRSAQPPASPQIPANPVQRYPPQRFDVRRVFPMDPRGLYEKASLDIHPDTGTAYPCTQSDLDACGGTYRQASKDQSHKELRALWVPEPNEYPRVGVEKASRDIFDHNDPERTGRDLPTREHEAIGRLLTMLDNACHGPWGPDLAIKSFCDLDTVFFRGKLRGNVCVTWAARTEFYDPHDFGHTVDLGKGKALIQLQAQYLFVDWPCTDGRLFTMMFSTVLHEMV